MQPFSAFCVVVAIEEGVLRPKDGEMDNERQWGKVGRLD
jgi:hypothetical protein